MVCIKTPIILRSVTICHIQENQNGGVDRYTQNSVKAFASLWPERLDKPFLLRVADLDARSVLFPDVARNIEAERLLGAVDI